MLERKADQKRRWVKSYEHKLKNKKGEKNVGRKTEVDCVVKGETEKAEEKTEKGRNEDRQIITQNRNLTLKCSATFRKFTKYMYFAFAKSTQSLNFKTVSFGRRI